MKDITEYAMEVITKRAPVWAAAMAGRTKVFTGDVPTAHVEGGGGRFKIVVSPRLAASPDLEFVLLHEIAHIFRSDLKSMHKHQAMAQQINIAADCIINDSLINLGVPKPAGDICWGKDIYKMDCTGKSINQLLDLKQQGGEGKETAPGNVTAEGEEAVSEEGEAGEEEGDHNKGGSNMGEMGLGLDPVLHKQLKPMAHSIAAYARSMFFETGFKSNNMVTKLDWRKNRSAFLGRTDIAIPRTKTVVGGKERGGPLINLVLDTSGSMAPSWVATASAIATEIKQAGLDFDLWISPYSAKATNAELILDRLQKDEDYGDLMDFDTRLGGVIDKEPIKGAASRAHRCSKPHAGGADELEALARMKTKDPVVWIYIGDYHSRMNLQLHYDKNFLHVFLVDTKGYNSSSAIDGNRRILDKNLLPRWYYAL